MSNELLRGFKFFSASFYASAAIRAVMPNTNKFFGCDGYSDSFLSLLGNLAQAKTLIQQTPFHQLPIYIHSLEENILDYSGQKGRYLPTLRCFLTDNASMFQKFSRNRTYRHNLLFLAGFEIQSRDVVHP
jgi:hypothetical protein